MKTYLDCYPCLLRQVLSAARRAGASENRQHSINHFINTRSLKSLSAEREGWDEGKYNAKTFGTINILFTTMEELRDFPSDSTPPQLAYRIHQQVQQLTNNIDPYRDAKDQANYESISNSSAPIFFLLQAKCNVIARVLGIAEGGVRC